MWYFPSRLQEDIRTWGGCITSSVLYNLSLISSKPQAQGWKVKADCYSGPNMLRKSNSFLAIPWVNLELRAEPFFVEVLTNMYVFVYLRKLWQCDQGRNDQTDNTNMWRLDREVGGCPSIPDHHFGSSLESGFLGKYHCWYLPLFFP